VWPSLFFAGLLFPRWALPTVLRDIGDWTPSGAAVHALQDSMLGTFPSAQLLLVLAGWAAPENSVMCLAGFRLGLGLRRPWLDRPARKDRRPGRGWLFACEELIDDGIPFLVVAVLPAR
jgi:hypothetical protein